jgi:hypothetical protein
VNRMTAKCRSRHMFSQNAECFNLALSSQCQPLHPAALCGS